MKGLSDLRSGRGSFCFGTLSTDEETMSQKVRHRLSLNCCKANSSIDAEGLIPVVRGGRGEGQGVVKISLARGADFRRP